MFEEPLAPRIKLEIFTTVVNHKRNHQQRQLPLVVAKGIRAVLVGIVVVRILQLLRLALRHPLQIVEAIEAVVHVIYIKVELLTRKREGVSLVLQIIDRRSMRCVVRLIRAFLILVAVIGRIVRVGHADSGGRSAACMRSLKLYQQRDNGV